MTMRTTMRAALTSLTIAAVLPVSYAAAQDKTGEAPKRVLIYSDSNA